VHSTFVFSISVHLASTVSNSTRVELDGDRQPHVESPSLLVDGRLLDSGICTWTGIVRNVPNMVLDFGVSRYGSVAASPAAATATRSNGCRATGPLRSTVQILLKSTARVGVSAEPEADARHRGRLPCSQCNGSRIAAGFDDVIKQTVCSQGDMTGDPGGEDIYARCQEICVFQRTYKRTNQ
jgi:hypothetical protein